ncbi:hypothetical protein FN846DRAFT_420964 [Sphaerosporella brunnea]|uniref:NAD(P)-binding domain-containing protein n=1 Tax=Sphaerosporella brunnea TaxID=1250544 RepID=A0A5J5EGZ2_9PEZI|nr:hypothetical protein FN846DRAFT_420964 [Sphaerosporella brunnea]
MTTATVVGSTGLVGSQILNQLLSIAKVSTVTTLTRRPSPHAIADPTSKLKATINSDSSAWATLIPATSTFFSALGTTRADAGSLAAQRAIDYDLNLSLAKAAKERGVNTYVLISSAGANAKSWTPYSAMKGQLEEEVAALGFEKCVILRPGLIVGAREKARWIEQPLHAFANLLGGVRAGLKDVWAQDAETIARAAIRAGVEEEVWNGRKMVEGKNGGKVWTMGQAEIVELGKL